MKFFEFPRRVVMVNEVKMIQLYVQTSIVNIIHIVIRCDNVDSTTL